MKRADLLEYKEKDSKNTDGVPLVLTFSRHLPNVQHILKKHENILEKSERMVKIFTEPPMVTFLYMGS